MKTQTKSPPAARAPTAAARAKHRVFIIDDHPMVREGSTALINTQADLVVCGSASDAAGAIDAIDQAQPDVVIVDLNLEGRNGLDLIKNLVSLKPKLPVVVYSMYDETIYAERVLRARGRGYVMKREPTENLLNALRAVLAGRYAFSPAISSRLLSRFAAPRRTTSEVIQELTDRELEVFEAYGHGLRPQAIADKLHLSNKTVNSHLDNIKRKLGLPDSSQVLQHAIRWVQELRGV